MDYVYFAAGLVALFLSGDALIRGSIGMARSFSIPPLLIGLTVVGFGTSAPELLVSIDAAMRGIPDIAIGNVVGSNIANILLIIGISSLLWPIFVPNSTIRRDIAVMLIATLALLPLFWIGTIDRTAGAVLFTGLAGYILWSYLKPGETPDIGLETAPPLWQSLLWVAIGLIGLVIGARLLVDGAVLIARSFGLSEAFIGLTIVAIGTSLPELATALVAAWRRQSDIALGNVIGSNIFNVLCILGITALIIPIPVATRFLVIDLPILLAITIFFTLLLLLSSRIGRAAGALMLVSYAAYVAFAMS